MRWTENQKQAIETRGGNVLVAAGAGAGKTGVLSRRIVARLEEGCDIDELLVLTFTRAAANEMRNRIRKGIIEGLPENRRHFSRQLRLLSGAPILTIHSFCLQLLRRHFNLLPALDPKFKILDQNQAKVVRDDALQSFFEAQYLESDIDRREDFLRLLRYFGDRQSDDGLKQEILRLLDFGQGEGDLEEWAAHGLALFQDRDFWRQKAKEALNGDLNSALEVLNDAVSYCAAMAGPAGYIDSLNDDIAYVAALQTLEWEALSECVPAFGRLAAKKKSDDPIVAAWVKKRRDAAKDMVKAALLLTRCEEDAAAHEGVTADLTALVQRTQDFAALFSTYKRKKGWLEFQDLERYAHRLLAENPALAEEYRRHFVEIFVDEYQDINGLQGKILNRLSGGDNLFLVGDVKQSIYGFRGADHRLFQGKYERFSASEAAEPVGALILLNENFRSRPEILAAANFFFHQLMSKEAVDLAYDEAAALNCGRADGEEGGHSVELLFVTDPEEDEIDEAYDYPEKIQAQARIIGERIEAMVEKGFSVPGEAGPRPVSYGDFAILLRNDVGRIALIESELKRRGLPAESGGSDGNAGQEVRLLIALLAVLDNPRQDIPLAAVLRSPLFGFDEEMLLAIGRRPKTKRLWDALQQEWPEPIAAAVKAVLEKISAWRRLSKRYGVGDLLLLLLEETDYQAFWGALPNGRQRVGHIVAFQERARAFQEQYQGGIFSFLRYMERVEGFGPTGFSDGGDTVKVMTMHRAKGLEFPIVFLANLEHGFHKDEGKPLLALDRELGFGPKIKDWRLRARYPTLARHLIDRKGRRAATAEEMRILYVAMTRAKEKLFLVGAGDRQKLGKMLERCALWERPKLPAGDVLAAGSYLQWLAMAAGRHRDLGGRGDLPYGEFALEVKEVTATGPVSPAKRREAAVAMMPLPLERLEKMARPGPRLPLKVTVTDLLPKEETPKRPEFGKQTALTAADRGTAFHRLMELIPFDRGWDLPSLAAYQQELKDRDILGEREIASLDNEAVLAFLASDYGRALRNSAVVKRELPFTVGFPAKRLFPGGGEGKVMLQGAVDLLFQSAEGDWFLLDYKNMPLRDREAFFQAYRLQMELYCEAMENLYHIRIREGAFYLTAERAFFPAYPV